MISTIAFTALLAFHGQSSNIDSYVQKNLRDGQLVAKPLSANPRALAKINSDFERSYRAKATNISFKEPFMYRADMTVDGSKLSIVQNGTRIKYKTPIVNSSQNLAKQPQKLRTLMELGVLTPALFNNFCDAKFVRMDRQTGDAVFDLTYVTALDDTTRYRVWIDPAKKYTTRREWYGQGHKAPLRAIFVYDNPVEVNGVWFPTRSTVFNADNEKAGVIQNEEIKINEGLSESIFSVK